MSEAQPNITCPSGTVVIIDSQEFYQLLERIIRQEILPMQMIEKLKILSAEKNPTPGPLKTVSVQGYARWNITIESNSSEPKSIRTLLLSTEK